MGSQWRSCEHIIEAGNFIRSGKLGKVSLVRGWAYLDGFASLGKPPDGPAPAGRRLRQPGWARRPNMHSIQTGSILISAGSGIMQAG
jgi:hypothetical protein